MKYVVRSNNIPLKIEVLPSNIILTKLLESYLKEQMITKKIGSVLSIIGIAHESEGGHQKRFGMKGVVRLFVK
jgi:hypothetical protein